VSTLGQAGGVSARMVVSHLDVCSELVALAVRVPGRGRRTFRVPGPARAPQPHGHGRAARRDWRFGRRHGVEMCSGVRGRYRCKQTMVMIFDHRTGV
jgi:hypothetical protein